MTKEGLRRDNLGQGPKRNERSRRKGAEGHADAAKGRLRRNDILPSLRIEIYPVDALKSHVRSLRKRDAVHIREIADSIHALGFNVPVLIGKDNIIVDGDSRVEAAKLLGLSSVPCIRVDHLDEIEQRLLRLAVNRLGEKGAWDLDELKVEFEELTIAGAPIEISGFGVDEVEQLTEEGREDRPALTIDVAPSPDPAVARPGDVFRLGPHCVICGDAADPAVIRRLMGDDVARFVLTDAPLDVATGGDATGEVEELDKAFGADARTDGVLRDANRTWIEAVLPHLMDGGLLGPFIDWRGLPIVHAFATALGLTPLDLVVWAKAKAGVGSLYPSQHELLPLFKKGSAAHVNNLPTGKRQGQRSNLWTSANGDHGSEKPTAMLQAALIDLTNRGDVVLDPFLGTGTTLIAADKAGRVCRGIEIDPRYVDVIIRRYEAITRETAILADTGEPFAVLTARRRNDGGGSTC
jgi:DNA modification methylase